MDFTLTDEQQMLADTAHDLLAKECPPSLVRDHIDDIATADPLWLHLKDWVVLGDGAATDFALFLQACGEVLAPGPFLPTAALLTPLLALGGSPRLESATAGELRGTVALAGPSGHWTPTDDPAKTFVLEADRVDVVAVVNRRAEGGLDVLLVDRPRDLPATLVQGLDTTRRAFDVDTTAAADLAVERFSLDAEAMTRWYRRATVSAAADLLGTARRILDLSVAYAKERVQFDVPIGSFQAIQHKLADMSLDVVRAEGAVAFAAMCIEADHPDQVRAVHVAKSAAGTAAMHTAKGGIQTHGGIGYTWEHDLHLYIRRTMFGEAFLGSRTWHQDRIADLLLA
ncbi:MAG TPA: acyl-CoA dehydrogenase [Acidimicrobiales bacterium]